MEPTIPDKAMGSVTCYHTTECYNFDQMKERREASQQEIERYNLRKCVACFRNEAEHYHP